MEENSALTLLPTKLARPNPPTNLVSRTRLDELLDSVLDDPNCRVALVSAPAGSGKSTLVSGWAASRSERSCWLQVDEADRDPVRFWTYLLAALTSAAPGFEELPGPMIAAAALAPEPIIAHITNQLIDLEEPITVVIDDYHLIAEPAIDGAVERLIELTPPMMRLVLVTRLDPGFRLSRLRVREQLVEIRADHLRFNGDEAQQLLGARAEQLAEHHVAALCDRTEGWAAGLVLAGLSLKSSSDPDEFVAAFQGDDRLVVDYLTEEFLANVSAEDRTRLLQTSVLEQMSGPLVDAVCDGTGGTDWLRATAESNQLLIGLDRTGTWYRYHHLLRDLLRVEAAQTIGGRLSELHRRAGHWHRSSGDMNSAVEHLLEADDRSAAADLIAPNATELLNGGRLHTVLRYLDRLGETLESHSGCCIVRAWTTFFAGRFGEAERWMAKAERLDVDGVDNGLIAALDTMIHVARGDIAGAVAVAADSPEPSDPTHAMVLGGVLVWAGRFDDARPHLRLATEMAAAAPDDFAASVTPVFEAILELEANNPTAATRAARDAIAIADKHGIGEAAQMSLAHSVLGRTESKAEPSMAAVRRGVELARRSPENIMMAYALASAGDVLSDNGDPEGAQLLREARTIIDRCVDPGVAGAYLSRAEGRHGQASVASMPDLVEELTDREVAVLRYLPSELSQRDIANELYVSLNTVKTHCKAVYRKLGVGDRKAAVQAAREQGIL